MPEFASRNAALKLSRSDLGDLNLTAHVPIQMSQEEFGVIAAHSYDLISKLTGCNCMSGRINFQIEENFGELLQVNLGPARG